MPLHRDFVAVEATRCGAVRQAARRGGGTAGAARRGSRPVLLVLRALGLGDLLTAVPALRGLARAFPEHRRVLAAPAPLRALLPLIAGERGEPAVEELLDVRLLTPAALAGAGRLPALFGGGGPSRLDVAVNLHGRGPASHRLLLRERPGRLLAFAHPDVPESLGLPRWRAGEHEISRWCRMLGESGIACEPWRLDIACPAVDLPPGTRGATVIHPGAASGARRWPAERWAAVAAAERIVGRRVLITGSPAERPLGRAIAQAAGLPAEAVLAGRTTIEQLAAVVAAAGRLLCGDTGAGHLATALGTPSVLLFGPVSPHEWGPRPAPPAPMPPSGAAALGSPEARHCVLWAGRTGDPHGDAPDSGLLRIAVSDVLDALEQLDAR